MKVLFVLPKLSGGGAERVVTSVAARLRELQADTLSVEIVVLLEESGTASEPGVTFLDARSVRRALPGLMWLIRKEKPDVVVSTLMHVTATVALARALGSHCFTHVCRVANTYSSELSSFPVFKRLLFSAAIRLSDLFIDRYICVSRGVMADLADGFGFAAGKCATIYNPVDSEKLDSLSARPVPPLAVAGAKFVLAVGRLSPQKDYPTLIRAFAGLDRGTTLVILGEGGERQRLETLCCELGVAGRVLFLGQVDNPYPYFRMASVFVLSSRYEGLPNVMLEAMYFGLPVVSTDCPHGPAELLSMAPGLGELVAVGDCVALTAALDRALDLTPARGPFAQSRFSIDRIALEYLSVIERT